MGKFYELFHMDAATAVSHLGLIYMKVAVLNSWFFPQVLEFYGYRGSYKIKLQTSCIWSGQHCL